MASNHGPRVVLTEESLRDGLQIERPGIDVGQKLELIDALVAAGLRRIVVGSFVSPKWTPQMADIDGLVAQLRPTAGVDYLALALNERGRERRRRWTPPLAVVNEAETHLHACPVFIQRNTNQTMAAQDATLDGTVARWAMDGATTAIIGLSAPWGSNFTGPVESAHRLALLRRQQDAWRVHGVRVDTILLADPMGWNSPRQVGADIELYQREFPEVTRYHLHLHNTRGLAMASAYAALQALGSDKTLELDSSVGGLGGCPYCGNGRAAGMIPTEDLVQLLEASGIKTGVDLGRLVEASWLMSEMVGRRLDSRVASAGPLPGTDELYDPSMPVVETHDEAQHFRLGAGTYAGRPAPWTTPPSQNPRKL